MEFLCFNHFTLANDILQKLLCLRAPYSILLASTKTGKQSFEITVKVKTLSAAHILECPKWLWVGKIVPSLLKLTVISDKNQYLIFLIVYYLIDPNFITLYGKKNQEGDRPWNPPGTSSGGSRGKFGGGGNKWHTLFGGSNLNPPEQVEAVWGVI